MKLYFLIKNLKLHGMWNKNNHNYISLTSFSKDVFVINDDDLFMRIYCQIATKNVIALGNDRNRFSFIILSFLLSFHHL